MPIYKAIGTVIGAFVFDSGHSAWAAPGCWWNGRSTKRSWDVERRRGRLPVGDPSDPETVMGPLASRKQLEKVAGSLTPRPEGGEIIVGGNPWT